MLATVSFDAFLAQLVYFLVSLAIDSRRDLQEPLLLETRPDELTERQKLSLYFIKRFIIFKNFLNKRDVTSHI